MTEKPAEKTETIVRTDKRPPAGRANRYDYDPLRIRKLLMDQKEIYKFGAAADKQAMPLFRLMYM
ncbi:hypothetical protein [Sporolactobacillus sp. KGMB 08714]|uniref:hypothetical protein n=1 Tax=Sporolactobacillus sp. KGMB 08714 TaxID=3064704 RepID=UPI002FBD375F